MTPPKKLTPLIVLVFLLLNGCAQSEPTPTLAPTSTSITTPIPTLTPTATPLWDLVVIGDSTLQGVGSYYAGQLHDYLDVGVRFHERIIENLNARRLLKMLEEDEALRELIAEAEVVVFQADSRGSMSETFPGDWNCESSRREPEYCLPETFFAYKSDLRDIIEAIFSLRDGAPTLLRMLDFYAPIYSRWQTWGIQEACTFCWETQNAAIHQVGEEYGVPVARVYDVFNGPNHDEDPAQKGYLNPNDTTPSPRGQAIIALLLGNLGYVATEVGGR